ncbi:sperm-tail PG-rich repeat-containing protein 2 [Monodelphis domestica]|uniref:sperm-tail PG-rich repeat-containing protein 2 n=1 Tax=Monodelphis domestica TaxID=13616 RepID=UPI0024E19848|nr:sperm-tail PG-rich repeat-containing protein 2 [Monodelphis domestica]XP_056659289.1 sperm-tail PG-rich repeat-containing protein 2 [Monodelphis domestica]
MYDRAPRETTLANVTSTDVHVGPGSYQVAKKHEVADGYAPFLSLAARESTSLEEDAPGPAHYNIAKIKYNIKGGLSLKNREARFKKFRSDNPGPGTYNQACFGALQIINRTMKDVKQRCLLKAPRIFKVARNLDVPSIPSPGQSHGYYVQADGSILRQSPPFVDKTLGPAFYKPLFDASDSTLKYKGIHFGNQSGRRDVPILEGPGPGEYDIVQESALHYENVNIKKEDKIKTCPFLPRYHEVIVLQEAKKGVPGPGSYDIKRHFGDVDDITINETHPAFLSQCQRFVPVKSFTPAPGTYDDHRTALESLKKLPGTKRTPFGRTSIRFTPDYCLTATPGPGWYNILKGSSPIENLENQIMQRRNKSAFGSSAPRKFFAIKEEDFPFPGPADYQIISVPQDSLRRCKESATFMSKVERKHKITVDTPPPGYYDIQKSFDKSYGKPKYMPPRTCMARKMHNSFLSSSPRILDIKKEGPGPATYYPVLKTSSKLSFFPKEERRFLEPKYLTPGPGTYKLSKVFRDTVLKGTFNATLRNPLLTRVENECKDHTIKIQFQPGSKPAF